MTTEEKLDRVATNLDRLTGVVDALAGSVVAHDNQIENLIKLGEEHDRRLKELTQAVANTEEQWQAYIKALPRS